MRLPGDCGNHGVLLERVGWDRGGVRVVAVVDGHGDFWADVRDSAISALRVQYGRKQDGDASVEGLVSATNKSRTGTMNTIGDIRRRMKKAYKRLKNWRAVANEYGVDPSLAWQIVEQNYDPKKPKNRMKLGLPAMAPAPVCRICGIVHVSKRCPTKRAIRRRSLLDFPVDELRRMLEERVEV